MLGSESPDTSQQQFKGRTDLLGRTLDPEFDVPSGRPPIAAVADRWQRKGAHAGMGLLHFLHQRRDQRLGGLVNHHGAFGLRRAIEVLGVLGLENRLDHRPCHHRKPRHEVVARDGKAGNAVERVGDDARPLWELSHFQALLVLRLRHVGASLTLGRHFRAALRDKLCGFRMQRDRHAECRRGRLARVIVGGGADAAAAENDIVAGKAAPQRISNGGALVRQVLGPGQPQAPRA